MGQRDAPFGDDRSLRIPAAYHFSFKCPLSARSRDFHSVFVSPASSRHFSASTIPSGTTLGPIDPVKYAESFGAHGFMIQSPDQIQGVLKQSFDTPGPVLIGVHVDYRDNHKLFEMVNERSIH